MNPFKINDRVEGVNSKRPGIIVGVFGEFIWVKHEAENSDDWPPMSYRYDRWVKRVPKLEAGKSYTYNGDTTTTPIVYECLYADDKVAFMRWVSNYQGGKIKHSHEPQEYAGNYTLVGCPGD